MNEIDLIELLVSQRESTLNLWKNLLTVSLAIIAFYGAMKSRVENYINWILLSLFCLFAASNFRALWKSFTIREDIGSLLIGVNPDSPFLASLVRSSYVQYLNLGFHLMVDLCVVVLFLGMYSHSKSRSGTSTNADTASSVGS